MSEKPDELKMDELDRASGGGTGDGGDLTSMRLQTYMDQRSKFSETLSNLLKKISNTASQITGNLK
jgi:hypothetical protein